MFIIIDGTNDYSDYEQFSNTIEEIKSSMPKMDKELTMFSVGPKAILGIVDRYCTEHEQVREKRIKYYSYSVDRILEYGLSRFNCYVRLSPTGVDVKKIEEGFSFV